MHTRLFKNGIMCMSMMCKSGNCIMRFLCALGEKPFWVRAYL